VRLSPTLDDVQHAINRTAVTVMACSKRVWQWGQLSVPEAEKRSFFDILGCDLEIIKVSLLLTGALHNTKSAVSKYLSTFRMYDWIWKEDKDEAYQRFLATTPMTADFEAEVIQRCNVPVFCVDRN
jgi:dynein heavy chain